MKKIKPLSKKHRFRKWIQRLFGIKQPSKVFAEQIGGSIDEWHLLRPSFPVVRLNPFSISAEIVECNPVTRTWIEDDIPDCVKSELAHKLATVLVEKDLVTYRKCFDAMDIKMKYRATLHVYAPERLEGKE